MSAYEIVNLSGFVGKEQVKGLANHEPKYPFKACEIVGQGFYVPIKGTGGDPAKESTLANMANNVSRQNKRERKAETGRRFSYKLHDDNPNWIAVWLAAG